jgi:hypothetical protein
MRRPDLLAALPSTALDDADRAVLEALRTRAVSLTPDASGTIDRMPAAGTCAPPQPAPAPPLGAAPPHDANHG